MGEGASGKPVSLQSLSGDLCFQVGNFHFLWLIREEEMENTKGESTGSVLQAQN